MNTSTSMLANYNLANFVYEQAVANPSQVAVVFENQKLTYWELALRADQLAKRLVHDQHWQIPTNRLPRVGILASRNATACIAVNAACWAGATYIPLGLKQPPDRIAAILQQCDFSALILDDEGQQLLSEDLLKHCPPIILHTDTDAPAQGDRPVDASILNMPARTRAEDTAYIIFTSGTTGVPKGVMINAGSVHHYISTMTQLLQLKNEDRITETCELSFDVSIHNMFTTWKAGAQLHIIPAAQAMNAVKFVQQAKITVWNSVPSMVGILRQIKALAANSMPTVRLSVFGGDQLPLRTVVDWKIAAPNSSVVNLYGPTEATVFCMWQNNLDVGDVTPGREIMTIGVPLPGNQASIMDAHGEEVPADTPGELWIAGDQLSDGYVNAVELSLQQFPTVNGQRWYKTGDVATKDSKGLYHYLGRMDNQIKVLGHRVELEEIDAHLRKATGSDLVGSVAWPVIEGMAVGVVSFVCGSQVDTSLATQKLKKNLPAYMLPSRIIELTNMPCNANGKVDRKALKALLESPKFAMNTHGHR